MSQVGVTAVQRVLRIFESFAIQQTPLSLTKLSEITDTPKSTCHAMVNTLVMEGYLYTLRSPRTLYPTKRIWEISQRINATDPIAQRLLPLLEQLRDQTKETVILGKRQGDAALYLQIIESRNAIRYIANPGDFKPLHSSAIGTALLLALPEVELSTVLKRVVLKRATPNTITTVAALRRDLRDATQRGYAMTSGENVADVSAVAIPLSLGSESFALAVAGPTHRIHQAVPVILKALSRLRDEIAPA